VFQALSYLDDFLTIDAPAVDGNRTMALLTMIFTKLNVPLAKHKTMSPLTMIEYLGIIANLPHSQNLNVPNVLTLLQMLLRLTDKKQKFCMV
jgi:hypothetical protein